jgi:hypothetical protein
VVDEAGSSSIDSSFVMESLSLPAVATAQAVWNDLIALSIAPPSPCVALFRCGDSKVRVKRLCGVKCGKSPAHCIHLICSSLVQPFLTLSMECEDPVTGIAFFPQPPSLPWLCATARGAVTVWDVERVMNKDEDGGGVSCFHVVDVELPDHPEGVAFDPSGGLIAFGCGRDVLVYNVKVRGCFSIPPAPNYVCDSFSPHLDAAV